MRSRLRTDLMIEAMTLRPVWTAAAPDERLVDGYGNCSVSREDRGIGC